MKHCLRTLFFISLLAFFKNPANAQFPLSDTTNVRCKVVCTNDTQSYNIMNARFIQSFRALYGDSLYFDYLKNKKNTIIILAFDEHDYLKSFYVHQPKSDTIGMFKFINERKWEILDKLLKMYDREVFVVAGVIGSKTTRLITIPFPTPCERSTDLHVSPALSVDIYCKRYEYPGKNFLDKIVIKDIDNLNEWYHYHQ